MSILNRIPLLLCLLLLYKVEVCWAQQPRAVKDKGNQILIPVPVAVPSTGGNKKPGTRITPLPIPGPKINCKELCFERCSMAERYRMCFRTCNTCCQRCNCVPSGTSGSTPACPCWGTATRARNTCP